ncbi:arginase [Cohnella sp. CFH 77786]|uniref:arginase n=1 Tax=Cohnella sp. CFH 77786 TaxID=2662265 RepID=UPI001C60EBE5|nr:arginase [Cohnella sp. CFH 77786]MBW5448266.1 arginase [Cohnella sp. CFH 77786]
MAAARKIRLMKVPFAVRTGRPGAEQGADSILDAGLGRMLRHLGKELAEERIAGSNVQEVGRLLADKTAAAVAEGEFPLIVGGDRSVSIGAISGLARRYDNLGVIWFDAHPSLLTERTSSTGYVNEMALASVLGKTDVDIPGLGRIRKENLVLIGLREVQPSESEWIRSEGITCFTMADVDRMGIQKVVEAALETAGNGTDGLHVSFDADCLDPLEAPGVVSAVPGGLYFREAHFACELLSDSGKVTSMDVTEVNPFLDDQRRTARLIAGLIASVLGKKIL